ALNAIGESLRSNELSATPPAAATAPGAPTLAVPTAGNGTVGLSWSAPASDGGGRITGYKIYRGTTSGAETLLNTVGAVTAYSDSTVSNGTTYFYKVSAVNSLGESTLSNERSAMPSVPATVPGQPVLSPATIGNNSVTLNWLTPGSGGSPITGYK